LKLVCFNANGIRARIHQLDAIKETLQPDLIGLQETKVSDEQFPVSDVESQGYTAAYHGQKGHYGVAILSKLPITEVIKGYPGDTDDAQRRFIACKVEHPKLGEVIVMNGYFPQGDSRSHPTKFPAKEAFYADLYDWISSTFTPNDQIILMGDMNISHQDIDIAIGEPNQKRWLRTGKCSFLPEERDWLNRLFDWGLYDTFRTLHPDTKKSSWFDYRSKAFDDNPKRGLRIDLILASKPLQEKLASADICHTIRAMDKPSDHCPIWATFS